MEAPSFKTIQIVVNGQPREVATGQMLLGLLRSLELDPARLAVELNGSIVRKPEWPSTPVESGARLEIVQFVGGG
ncbi:MAG: sulfur carrier protein ThiS [Bryobacteraceae bacterium]